MSLPENINHLKSKLSPAKQALLEKRLRGEVELKSQSKPLQEELTKVVPNADEQHKPFPLTDVQQAYWIGRQGIFELGNVASQAYLEIETVDLDLERFEKVWQRLINRHGMLRAIVQSDGQQQILEQVPAYNVKVLDLRGETPEIAASKLAETRDRLSHQRLPADQWPLFTIQASQLNNEKVRLHFNFDVLICDVWSLEIISRELAKLMHNPDIALPPLELSFRDYVLAEIAFRNSETYRRSVEYWQSRLATLPPSPELPLVKSLTTVKHPQFVRRTKKLAPDSWQRLKQRATQANVTPSGLLLAAFAEILTVWSKNPQFSINLTLFNPLPLHPEVNQIVGDFTSLTLLTVDNSGQESFKRRVQRIQKQLWEDLDHRYVSGVQVLRELARTRGQASAAFMPVVFTSTLTQNTQNQQSVPMTWLGELVYSITQTPQVYLDNQVFEDAGTLVLYWDAVEEVFSEGLLDDMFAAYYNFLENLANQEELWQAKTRQLLPPAQVKQLAAINETDTLVAETALLHTLFFDRVALHPQQAAVVTSSRTLTYQELCDRANNLAHQLRQQGIRPNQLVAIVMEKGWEQAVATLAILASGAAYVPIDPGLPSERRQHLLEEAQVQCILTQSWLNTSLEWSENIRHLCIDTVEPPSSSTPLESIQQPSDLAYVIYTSGSTGKPKGVMIDHRGAVNTILDINQRFNVQPQDRVFALSSLSFDLSVYDIFGTLAAGGTIVIPDADATKDPAHWAQLMLQHQVTIWNSVPALMQMLVEYAANRSELLPQSLRLAMLSGDWLPLSLPDQIRTLFKDVQVISLGGATEASIWSILYPIEQVDPTWKSIPYGRPMRHQHFYVLNEVLEPCPVWVTGQLYIGGIGLAKGYWRNPEKTNASFIIHPRTQERLYKTGDLGRYLPDGNIEFIGREDFQVKVNGHRIELGEIEATLQQHPSVKEVIVTAVGESRENKQLIAYVVPTPEEISTRLVTESGDASPSQRLWESLIQAGYHQAQNDFWELDFPTFSELWKYQDYLYIISVCRALRNLGVYNFPEEKYDIDDLMSRCQIAPRYRKWLKRSLKELIKEGFLRQKGRLFESIIELPTVVAQELSAETQVKLSKTSGLTKKWIDLLPVEPAENLANIITETIHSAEIYASEDTVDAYEIIFADCNAIAQEMIKAVVQALEPGKQLRILEIGGGYGTTASQILPLLPPKQTTYVFTDISNFFLKKAKDNFADYPFVNYDILNIEQHPDEQGYGSQTFDIVIATTVLHNTRSIEETLRHIRSLLAPNGLLLAIEKTQFHRAFDLSMGLQQGFDRFEDEPLRSEHPVLSKEQWHRTLSNVGFVDSVFMNQPGSVADFIGFDVLIARNPFTVKQFNSNKVRDFLQKKLPEYMVPAAYVVLDAMPLTPNGKVDRKILPVPKDIFSPSKAGYVMPQTEVEQLLATVWQEVLQIKKIGIHNNFFELGGDSLLATQVISKVRQRFQIELPIKSIFETPTVAGLSEQIEKMPRHTQRRQASTQAALGDREEGEL